MTLQSQLDQVLALSEKATPGEWEPDPGCYTDSGCRYNAIMAKDPWTEVLGQRGPSVDDAEFIASAVNFLRQHGPAIRAAVGGEAE